MKARVRRLRVTEQETPEPEMEEQELDENEQPETSSDQDRIEQKYRDRATSPLRAIRAFCVLCMGCQPRMVAGCTATNCVMYPFRFGKNPHQKHTKGVK